MSSSDRDEGEGHDPVRSFVPLRSGDGDYDGTSVRTESGDARVKDGPLKSEGCCGEPESLRSDELESEATEARSVADSASSEVGPPSYQTFDPRRTDVSPAAYRNSLLLVDPAGQVAGVAYDPRQSTSDISLHTLRKEHARRSVTSATERESFFTALEGGTIRTSPLDGVEARDARESFIDGVGGDTGRTLFLHPSGDRTSRVEVQQLNSYPSVHFDLAAEAEVAFWHLIMPSASVISSTVSYLTNLLIPRSEGWTILQIDEQGRAIRRQALI